MIFREALCLLSIRKPNELNRMIKAQSPTVYDLLSEKGKAIYFPKMGILAQGNAAKGKEINATIGTAYEDDGKPMILPSIAADCCWIAKTPSLMPPVTASNLSGKNGWS